MLENTNIVRKSLSDSCEKTRKVVKCWTFPDKDEDDSPNGSITINHAECTCYISAFDESSEEIAKGIGDIVQNAQKLREKISTKKSSAIATKQILCNNFTPTTKRDAANHRTGSVPSVPFSGGARNGLSNTSIPKLSVSRAISKNTVKNPPSSLPRLKSVPSTQSTYQKDFPSHPSSRISNESAKSIASRTQGTVKSVQNSGDGPITMAQLEELLDRVAVDATLYSSQIKTTNTVNAPNKIKPPPNETCPIHGNKVPVQNIQASVKHVEFKEALSIVGVPSKLVKILQPYHRFMSQYENGEKPAEPKSATRFLSELNNMVNKWVSLKYLQ
jgi:hypothetical protein